MKLFFRYEDSVLEILGVQNNIPLPIICFLDQLHALRSFYTHIVFYHDGGIISISLLVYEAFAFLCH